MRKALVLLAIVVTQAMVSVAPLVPAARGQAAIPVPELVLTIIAGNATQLTFSPDAIRVPQVPILLNITVINHGTVGHTFTIRDTGGTPRVDLVLPAADSRSTVRFQVNASSTGAALGDIFYNGSAFVPERGVSGIRFFCVPHESALMVGQIVLATVGTAGPEEKGIFLRAYWIGIIALGAMIAWTGVTYLLIKTSSRRFTDHRDHIRRGLP